MDRRAITLDPTFAPGAPARFVLRHLPTSIYAVAPERADRLQSSVADCRLSLVDDSAWICEVAPKIKEIRVSVGTMTILWCFSHAYVVLHDRVFLRWMTAGGGDVDLTTDPVVAAAMRLLQWAMIGWKTGSRPNWTWSWPGGVLMPVEHAAEGSPENVADELALVAAAFLVHHELAHVYLRHGPCGPGAESIDQERDADGEAASWLLSGLHHDDHRFVKRALGIATALGASTALGIHTGYYGGSTHPRHFDRLKHALDPYIPVEHHKVWQFIILALKLHIDNVGLSVASRTFDSGRECFESYLDVLGEDAAG